MYACRSCVVSPSFVVCALYANLRALKQLSRSHCPFIGSGQLTRTTKSTGVDDKAIVICPYRRKIIQKLFHLLDTYISMSIGSNFIFSLREFINHLNISSVIYI